MVATRLTQAECSKQSCKQRVTSFSSQFTHAHPTSQRHIKANGDERERREEMNSDRKTKKIYIPVHIIFLPASLFNCRQINSDFSLDGPMWKRKKA